MMNAILRNKHCDINISDNNNKTAFYHSCEFGNPSILRKLIEFGCNIVDINLNNIMNNIIISNGNYKLLLMLIQMFPIEYYCDIFNNTISITVSFFFNIFFKIIFRLWKCDHPQLLKFLNMISGAFPSSQKLWKIQ